MTAFYGAGETGKNILLGLEDSLRFTVNGEELSGYSTDVDLFAATTGENISLENVSVRGYGIIRNGTKTAEVMNDSMQLRDGVLIQLYTDHTAETFGFSEAAALSSSGETSGEENDTPYDVTLIVRKLK